MSLPDLTACTILLVDDEQANLNLLENLLAESGFRSLVSVSDAREAVPLFQAVRPDLVLLDLHMPHRTGFDVLQDVRALTPDDDYVPVLVLTADATFAAKKRALNGGAHDFITKPFINAEVLLRVRNLLHTRALYREQLRGREAAERSERRAVLLAEASRLLYSSFDNATALAQVARLLTVELADGCMIDLHQEGVPIRVATAFRDPDSAPGEVYAISGPGAAEPISDESLFRQADAVIEAPLASVGVPVGRIVLARRGTTPPFRPEDVALVEELGRRAALAVQNARMYSEACAATTDRDRILAVVAHDLRTPLTALQMDAEMLHARLGEEQHGRALRRMYRSVERMQGLIQDLLDAARMDRGMLTLDVREHPAGGILKEAAEMLQPLVEASGISFVCRDSEGTAALLQADDARILQVISNLVGNSLKFTPAGGTISLAGEVREGEYWISVRDTGPGIPAEEIPHLFGAFWQARYADRRGIGLGLAIARGIVEAHQGRIWVTSEPGHGTSFTFALPLVSGDLPDELDGSARHPVSPVPA